METKQIAVKSRGDIKVSQKTKKPYFVITDQDDIKYITYKVSLHNDFGVAMEGEIEFDPSKYADGTNSLIGWHKPQEDTPEALQPQKKADEIKLPQGVSKPEIAPQEKGKWWKHRAFALSYAKDLACYGIIEIKDLYKYAEEMFDWLNKDMV